MRVIDTSIWIEIFLGSELGKLHLPKASDLPNIIVPTIVQFEIYKWLARERNKDDANQTMTVTNDCQVQVLTTGIATLAAELSALLKLHATDAMIYATAQVHDAPLFTCDAHFKGLPGVEYFEKG